MREEAASDFWVLWTVETWRWLKPGAVRLTPTQSELSLRLTMPRGEGNKVNKPHRQQTLETRFTGHKGSEALLIKPTRTQ